MRLLLWQIGRWVMPDRLVLILLYRHLGDDLVNLIVVLDIELAYH